MRPGSRARLRRQVEEALEALPPSARSARATATSRAPADETGLCNTGRHARVSSHFPHFGEEDCLRGWNGSGTIFFSFCNLRCVFCQNWDVSQEGEGARCGRGELAGMMLELQARGCHNINFVTPEHVVPADPRSARPTRSRAVCACRSSTTPAPTTSHRIRLLDGVVDIYMPDFKYWDAERARRYLKAPRTTRTRPRRDPRDAPRRWAS